MEIEVDTHSQEQKLTRKDFVSGQEVRWCPGCGDYAILAQVQKIMPEVGIPREKIVFVSGIGCSSRFPYYMNTYGFHTIHGRAPAVATGLKIANPELSVWVVTGDGDGLSIGAGHFIHTLRRNVDLNLLLFNNRIYGLTKGQYSPTSEAGKKTKSSPWGSVERPMNPVRLALAAEATFVARTVDVHIKHMAETLLAAAAHKGTSFIEIYQNCIVFNDKTFADITERSVRDERLLEVVHGKPMRFGKDNEFGIVVRGTRPEVVRVDEVGEDRILVHDSSDPNIASLLSKMEPPDYPAPIGVFYERHSPTYDELLIRQIENVIQNKGPGNLQKLLDGPSPWEIS
ncbi:MAG: 2-oxoacid:ferredoxin oxidoreductase subunit beta [Candidatus Omnitrophica bacterium]|nr:2-oxoacid:ferredoxin oxidoreductase subunit beta [Candidatus Omnitrophota bacterium]